MSEPSPVLTCVDCNEEFARPGSRGPRPKRCSTCAPAFRLAQMRQASLAPRGGVYLVGPNAQYDRPDGQRECRVCGQIKPLDEFQVRDHKLTTRRNECRPCFLQLARGRYRADPGKHRDRMRRTNYGLALGEYDRMHAAQLGRCAICGETETSLHSNGKPRDLFVDHHHETGQVRDLLCMRCNMGIGQFRDDPDLLRKAIDYLNKHRAT